MEKMDEEGEQRRDEVSSRWRTIPMFLRKRVRHEVPRQLPQRNLTSVNTLLDIFRWGRFAADRAGVFQAEAEADLIPNYLFRPRPVQSQ